MTTADLIVDLASRDIRLRADGDRLVIDAPQDALTDEIRARLRERKADLLGELSAETQARNNIRVYRYRITDHPDQWPYMLAPGLTLDEVEDLLRRRYGDRLIEVRAHATTGG